MKSYHSTSFFSCKAYAVGSIILVVVLWTFHDKNGAIDSIDAIINLDMLASCWCDGLQLLILVLSSSIVVDRDMILLRGDSLLTGDTVNEVDNTIISIRANSTSKRDLLVAVAMIDWYPLPIAECLMPIDIWRSNGRLVRQSACTNNNTTGRAISTTISKYYNYKDDIRS